MFFSIIIPTYNRSKIIPRAITSILGQTYGNFEILIIDDGSTDDTEMTVSSFNDNRISYFKTVNFGVAHARNFGIKKAKFKYIGFLDSDDLLEANHLETAFDYIQKLNFPKVIHLNFLWGNEDKLNPNQNILPKVLPVDIFKSCSLHVNCIFIENEIAKENLFNESKELMFAEDWDFFIKLCIRYPIHLLNQNTAYLIDHEDRSMRDFDERKWVLKRDALALSLKSDLIIQAKYSTNVNSVIAHMNSLIALNLAIRKNKVRCASFLFLAITQNPKELTTLRTLAIIKYLILKW